MAPAKILALPGDTAIDVRLFTVIVAVAVTEVSAELVAVIV